MQVKNLVIEADDAISLMEFAIANKALVPEVTEKVKEAEEALQAIGLVSSKFERRTLSERIKRIRSVVKSSELFAS